MPYPLKKVIERLVWEGVVIDPKIQGKKTTITAEEAFRAGLQEPRIMEIVPALVYLYPKIFFRGARSLQDPVFVQLVDGLDTFSRKPDHLQFNISTRKAAQWIDHFKQLVPRTYRETKKTWIQIRVSMAMKEEMQRKAQSAGKSLSDWICTLADADRSR